MDVGRTFNDKLHYLSRAMAPSSSLPFWPPLTLVRLKRTVTVDNDPHRKPLPDRQCGLDVEIAPSGSLSGLIHAVAGSPTKRHDDIGITAGTGGRSKFAADPEQCRQQRGLQQGAQVIIDLVLETGIASRIRACLALQNNRATVRYDQAGPDQEDARLTKGAIWLS